MIYIPYSVPSAKSGRFPIKNKTTGKSFSVPSKQTQTYLKETKTYWLSYRNIFHQMIKDKTPPYIIGFHFIRGSHHEWDFINPCQTIQDEMVKYKWLPDDSVNYIYPVPLNIEGKLWDKKNKDGGIIIKVLNKFGDADYPIDLPKDIFKTL